NQEFSNVMRHRPSYGRTSVPHTKRYDPLFDCGSAFGVARLRRQTNAGTVAREGTPGLHRKPIAMSTDAAVPGLKLVTTGLGSVYLRQMKRKFEILFRGYVFALTALLLWSVWAGAQTNPPVPTTNTNLS